MSLSPKRIFKMKFAKHAGIFWSNFCPLLAEKSAECVFSQGWSIHEWCLWKHTVAQRSGSAGVCSPYVEERGRRCVCALHCRRGCASHRLMWYVFSSTSYLQQRLAYLAEIISLCLGLFSFIVKDKIKTLLTAICEWYWRKTREIFPLCDSTVHCVCGLNKFPHSNRQNGASFLCPSY